MMLSERTHSLIVEGTDDLYVIANLIQRERPSLPTPWPKFITAPPARPGDAGAVGAAIRTFSSVLEADNRARVGLVVDADDSAQSRWAEIRAVLTRQHWAPDSAALDPQGFIAQRDGRRVGVWLWPNNSASGALEDVLLSLIPDDALRAHAVDATTTARAMGAPFTLAAHQKAVLRTWLAWQEQPGLPPGDAISRRVVAGRTPTVDAFAAWFERLCTAE